MINRLNALDTMTTKEKIATLAKELVLLLLEVSDLQEIQGAECDALSNLRERVFALEREVGPCR